jgi:hypothetical protein
VLKLAYAEETMTAVLFEKIFSRDFDTLIHDWHAAMVAVSYPHGGRHAAGVRLS